MVTNSIRLGEDRVPRIRQFFARGPDTMIYRRYEIHGLQAEFIFFAELVLHRFTEPPKSKWRWMTNQKVVFSYYIGNPKRVIDTFS